jgi:hypothetical protein
MEYFSARLLMMCLVDTGRRSRKNMCDESVILFRARDLPHAFAQALKIGKAQQHEYINDKGQRVRWVLARVINLDHVGKTIDGIEVASKLGWHETKEPLAFNHSFHPNKELPAPSFS